MSGGMIVSGGGWCQGGRCGQVEDVVRRVDEVKGEDGVRREEGVRGKMG